MAAKMKHSISTASEKCNLESEQLQVHADELGLDPSVKDNPVLLQRLLEVMAWEKHVHGVIQDAALHFAAISDEKGFNARLKTVDEEQVKAATSEVKVCVKAYNSLKTAFAKRPKSDGGG